MASKDTAIPDRDRVMTWLERAGIEFYQCDHCHGLHLPRLQQLDGVSDSGLYVESHGILLSTELVIRPVAMLSMMADQGRLSVDYPVLKLFLDVVDDSMPQLVAGALQLTGAGLSFEQFHLFVATGLDATAQLAAECRHLDYLYLMDDSGEMPPHAPVH